MNSGLEDRQACWDREEVTSAALDGTPHDWFIYSHHSVWAQERACPCELILEKGRESLCLFLFFFFFFDLFIVQIFILLRRGPPGCIWGRGREGRLGTVRAEQYEGMGGGRQAVQR